MFKSILTKYEREIYLLEKNIISTLRENYTKTGIKAKDNPERLSLKEIQDFSKGWLILRDAFVDNPGNKDPNYLLEMDARSSYIFHYLMPNVQRWLHMYETSRMPFLKEKYNNPAILDIGAGPATSVLAFLIFFHKQITGEVTVELTDFNLAILKDGKLLLEKFAKDLGIKIKVFITGGMKKDLPPQVKGIDFVLMGNVWNEGISSHEAARNRVLIQWAESIKKISKESTKFLMMEPASRRSSRLLMGMRDYFAELNTFQIIAPCPAGLEHKPCVLNRQPGRPWCHFGFNSFMTPFLQDATSYASVSHERLSYSYLWLSYKKSEIVITARAIGGIMKLEENVGVYLCHQAGRIVLEAVDSKTLPSAGQAVIKKLVMQKVGKEFRAHIDEEADQIPNGGAVKKDVSKYKKPFAHSKPNATSEEKEYVKPAYKKEYPSKDVPVKPTNLKPLANKDAPAKTPYTKPLPRKPEIIKHIVKDPNRISAKRISKYPKKDDKKK